MTAKSLEGKARRKGKEPAPLAEQAKPLRLRDVADAAGVSVTTVSVVLNSAPNSGIPVRSTWRRYSALPAALGMFPMLLRSRCGPDGRAPLGSLATRSPAAPSPGR